MSFLALVMLAFMAWSLSWPGARSSSRQPVGVDLARWTELKAQVGGLVPPILPLPGRLEPKPSNSQAPAEGAWAAALLGEDPLPEGPGVLEHQEKLAQPAREGAAGAASEGAGLAVSVPRGEISRSEQTRSEETRSEQTRSEQVQSELSRSDRARVAPSRSGQDSGRGTGELAFSPESPSRAKPDVVRRDSLAGRFSSANRFTRYHLDEVPQAGKVLVLSFDGDHKANCVGQILEILAARGVRANVFLTGTFVAKYPEETRAIVKAGHEVGNHTFRHARLTSYEHNRTQTTLPQVNRDFLAGELEATEEAFLEVTGGALAPFWRAPFGEHNLQIRSWAYARGYLHVGWSKGFDSLDWFTEKGSRYYWEPRELLERFLRQIEVKAQDGRILLFHLGSLRPDEDQPYHMLAELIDRARERGFQFSTMGSLLDGELGVRSPMRSAAAQPVAGRESH